MYSSFLLKTERYFRTDLRYLFKNGTWLILGQGIASVSSLLLAFAFAHFVSQEIYGTYKYILTVASFITVFSLTGTRISLIRSITLGKDGTLAYLFKKNMLWSLPVLLIGLSLSGYYFVQGNPVLAFGMLLAGLSSPIIESANLYNSFLQGKKAFYHSTLINTFRIILPAVVIFVVIFNTSNIYYILLTYFTSTVLITYALYQIVNSKFSSNTDIDHSVLSYSKHLSLMNILSRTATTIDKLLVFHFLGAAQLAVYSFAVLIPKEIMSAHKKIAALALPRFVQRTTQEIKGSLIRKALLFSAAMLPIVIGYYFLAPYLYEFLFPAYTESVIYSQIYILALLGANEVVASVFESQRLLRENYYTKISSAVIRIVLMCAGFFSWGLLGLVIGKVCARFVTYGMNLFLVSRMR